MAHPANLPLDALVAYLNTCGGSDVFRLWDDQGAPDVEGARTLAEQLRARLGGRLDTLATVEQSFNRVDLSLVLEPARL